MLLAEQLVEVVPCAERVKFANSGSEATAAAVKFARAHTGRDRILKFEGAYHGTHDWAVWGSAPPGAPRLSGGRSRTRSACPATLGAYVLVAPYNDLAAAGALIREHRAELAAVIVEPLLGNVPPKPGFLDGVRAVTSECGIPLIFDEVVSGFRLALGGAQEYYGVVPDLAALGKSLGGGYPIGAIVGRDRALRVRHARRGRSAGGSPCTRGPSAAIRSPARRPWRPSRCCSSPGRSSGSTRWDRRLADGLREISRRLGVATFVVSEGPMVDLWFTDRP